MRGRSYGAFARGAATLSAGLLLASVTVPAAAHGTPLAPRAPVRADAGRLELTPGSATSIVAGSTGYPSMTWTAPERGFAGTVLLRLPVELGAPRGPGPAARGWRAGASGDCRAERVTASGPPAGAGGPATGPTVVVAARCGPRAQLRVDLIDLRAPTRSGVVTTYAAVRPRGAARATGVPGWAALRVVASTAARLLVSTPRRAVAGQSLSEPVLVTVLDGWGNRVVRPPYKVRLTARGRSGPVALSGTAAALTDNGVAAVRGLVLPAPSRGLVLAAAAGTAAGGRPPAVGESRPFRVLGPPARLRVVGGDGQSAPAGTPVPRRPAVRVVDAVGNGLPGLPVSFAATGRGVAWGIVPTDGSGVARTAWYLGPRGGRQLLRASVAGRTATLVATASGAPVGVGTHRG